MAHIRRKFFKILVLLIEIMIVIALWISFISNISLEQISFLGVPGDLVISTFASMALIINILSNTCNYQKWEQ